jgi:3-oxoadipate enol-lactonase
MMSSDQFIDIGRVRLAYCEAGAPAVGTIILAHSLFMNRQMFQPLMKRLSDQFRVIAYDARGHGASSQAVDERYDMEAFYDDAAAFIEALDCGPVHFAGNSMGGWTALRLAARRPELLRSSIAMGSSGEGEPDLRAFDPVLDNLRARGGQGIEDVFSNIFFGDFSMSNDAFAPVRDRWLKHLSELTPFFAEPGAAVAYRSPINAELRHCMIPILALAGAQDHVYPTGLSENIARAAPHGEWAVVEKAGHSVALEQPDTVAALIRNFIAGINLS